MKICNLKIFDPKQTLIRDINFNHNGVSFVLGDMELPKDKSKTSNSIGKTLLLKMVDYIFGANEDKTILKKELNGYTLLAKVVYNQKQYDITREIGSSSKIKIDNEEKTLEEYKAFFSLNRSLLSRQIILKSKQDIISIMPKPVEEDFNSILALLGLESLKNSVVKIYKLQNDLKQLATVREQILNLLDISAEKVSDEIFFIEKDIENTTKQITEANAKIKDLKINSVNASIQAEYAELNAKVKEFRNINFELLAEKDSLEKYLKDSESSSLDSRTIKKIYARAKIELPDIVLRTLDEVEKFYKSIYEDRIIQIKTRLEKIIAAVNENNAIIENLETQLDSKSKILATNDAYENSLEILYHLNNELQALKFRQGQLDQAARYIKEENAVNSDLLTEFSLLENIKGEIEETLKSYKNFVYELVDKIYGKGVRASFDMKFSKYDKKKRPISISMEITGDAGEGVKEVKKVIIDFLLFSFNNLLEIFIHDSSCYNGVDPRQVSGLLKELVTMAEQNQKQVIVSINKYQLADDEFTTFVYNHSAIVLSETDKLLGIDF